MTYDILKDGTVDPSSIVTECGDPRFVDQATQQIAGMRYNPKIEDGQPVVRRGVQTMLDFAVAR